MKKLLVIVLIAMILTIFSACKYNKEATVFVKNVGELTASVKIKYTKITLKPGEQEKFTLTWPAQDKSNWNLASFATAYPDKLWKNVNFWIKKDEVKYMEVEYYRPKKNTAISID